VALIDTGKTPDGGLVFDTEGPWSDGSRNPLSLPTGTWRTEHPILEERKCTHCGLCYLYCPPQCIHAEEEFFTIDLKFCKGCGICAKECPVDAITMVRDGEGGDGSG
jgi:2-oxoacid:acceptor oxidoreductase delta subunit (pyruvate/2-ketoisovalerate family)